MAATGNGLRAYERACVRTDALFEQVRPSAMPARPIGERHRLLFYLGHLEAFDWNLLGRDGLGMLSHTPELDTLFAFGIDPTDGELPCDEPEDWPDCAHIEAYVAGVRKRLRGALGSAGHPWLVAATEHRLMHAETLIYMLNQMPLRDLIAAPALPAVVAPAPTPARREVSEGVATLGQRRAGGGFGWDNEFDVTPVRVPAFDVDAYPVTQGDFLRFVRAGGYHDHTLWRADDWAWRERDGVEHPSLWRRRGDAWRVRILHHEVPLDPNWPVYVSFAEAAAYARSVGRALPSEAQWHRAAYGTPAGHERLFPWGDAWRDDAGNYGERVAHPVPVTAHPTGASAFDVHDLLGNGWEWTCTPFAPLPGFVAQSFYPTYSANFFDAAHYVLKGGGWSTAPTMLRRSYRNWFQPHYPYVHATFRTVNA